MGEPSKGFSAAGAGQLQNNASTGEQTPENTQQYLTRQEAQTLRQEILAESAKQSQSLTDKAESRIIKKIQEDINHLNAAAPGLGLTPEQIKTRRLGIIEEAFNTPETSTPASTSQAAQPAQGSQPATDPNTARFNQIAIEVLQENGLSDITPNDPEFSEIVTTGSERQFMKSIEAAAEKKAARLSTPPEARLPGGPGKPGAANRDALTNELIELNKHPVQNMPRIREVKEQLKKFNQ